MQQDSLESLISRVSNDPGLAATIDLIGSIWHKRCNEYLDSQVPDKSEEPELRPFLNIVKRQKYTPIELQINVYNNHRLAQSQPNQARDLLCEFLQWELYFKVMEADAIMRVSAERKISIWETVNNLKTKDEATRRAFPNRENYTHWVFTYFDRKIKATVDIGSRSDKESFKLVLEQRNRLDLLLLDFHQKEADRIYGISSAK